jgi:hypothetical protein
MMFDPETMFASGMISGTRLVNTVDESMLASARVENATAAVGKLCRNTSTPFAYTMQPSLQTIEPVPKYLTTNEQRAKMLWVFQRLDRAHDGKRTRCVGRWTGAAAVVSCESSYLTATQRKERTHVLEDERVNENVRRK